MTQPEDPLPPAQQPNPSIGHFDDFKTIYAGRKKRPLVNLYISYPQYAKYGPIGTVVFMPGYGGSPLDTFVRRAQSVALLSGFNIVVIENIELSATSGIIHNAKDMNISKHRVALARGIREITKMSELGGGYNIAWPHSMSCRALTDIVLADPELKDYFCETVMINPYFITRPDVINMRRKMLKKSEDLWNSAASRIKTQTRKIGKIEYSVPACIGNFFIPFHKKLKQPTEISQVDEFVNSLDTTFGLSKKLKKTKVHFILGEQDDKSVFNLHYSMTHALPIQKQVYTIPGADHNFDNTESEYEDYVCMVFGKIGKLGTSHQYS